MKRTSSIGQPQRFTNRASEHVTPVKKSIVRKHKRGISLFDNDNIMNVGLGGQPSSNLFQAQPKTFTNKGRRVKTIYY